MSPTIERKLPLGEESQSNRRGVERELPEFAPFWVTYSFKRSEIV